MAHLLHHRFGCQVIAVDHLHIIDAGEKTSGGGETREREISRISAEEQLNVVEASPLDLQIMKQVRPYTMTSPARLWAMINAVRYISVNRIKGDICECGVWRGGSMMAAALKLKSAEDLGTCGSTTRSPG